MPIKVKKYSRTVEPAGGITGSRKQVGYDPIARVLNEASNEMGTQARNWNRLAIEKKQAKEASEFAAGQAKYLEVLRVKQDELLKREDYGVWMDEVDTFHQEAIDEITAGMTEDGAREAFAKYSGTKKQVFLGDIQGMVNEREGQKILEDMNYALTQAITSGDGARGEALINSMPDWVLGDDKKGKMITSMYHDMDLSRGQAQAFSDYKTPLVREEYKHLSDDEFNGLERQRRREEEYQDYKIKQEQAEYQKGNYFKALDGMLGENGAPVSQNTIDGWRDNGDISEEHWYSLTQINRGLLNAGSSKIDPIEHAKALTWAADGLMLPIDHPDHVSFADLAEAVRDGKLKSSDISANGTLGAMVQIEKDMETNRKNAFGTSQLPGSGYAVIKSFVDQFELKDDDPESVPMLIQAYNNRLDELSRSDGDFDRNKPAEIARDIVATYAESTGLLEKKSNWYGEGKQFRKWSEGLDNLISNLEAQQAAAEKIALEMSGGGTVKEEPEFEEEDLTGGF